MRKNLVITEQNQKHLKGYEFITIDGKRFQFFVNATEGSSCMGYNSDLCIKMFNDEKGWVNICDNRFLNVSIKKSYGFEGANIVPSLCEVFDRFEEYLNELVGK